MIRTSCSEKPFDSLSVKEKSITVDWVLLCPSSRNHGVPISRVCKDEERYKVLREKLDSLSYVRGLSIKKVSVGERRGKSFGSY